MDTIKLRQEFLNFFRVNDHKFVNPSKVYNDDPTLFFVNAGMNQFKDVFIGNKPIEEYNKLMNYQLCIRAGGKHNDLNDVGKDSYHLTCFEMLGSWSLNSYWKEKSIELSFRFLTEVCHLNPKQMYATYFQGTKDISEDSESFISEDSESRDLWKKYLPENHIVPGSYKDNFWMMDEYGPCGVSSEIHYDIIGEIQKLDEVSGFREVPELVNCDDPTLIEIWNMVFVEYNKDQSGYHTLNQRFVDTGMGLERIAMIIQNKSSIFQIDIFRKIISYGIILTNGDFFTDQYITDDIKDISYRIFADHIRTTIICLHQGVKFGQHKRGFVLRKIFRRLLNHIYVYITKKLTLMMVNPIIKCLINDILDFHLYKNHNTDLIWMFLKNEEKMYIDKLHTTDKKIRKLEKILNDDEIILKMKDCYGVDMIITRLFLSKF